jgi:DNA-binding response OmpR family regulator
MVPTPLPGAGAEEPRHILVADDEPHIGRIIQLKLEQGAVRGHAGRDGRGAGALLGDEPIDLVLLDIMMPT